MAAIRVSVDVTGRPIVGPLVAAIRRHVTAALSALADDALRAWRRATPKVSGDLRRSELVVDLVPPAAGSEWGVQFRVVAPGSRYYHLVRRRYPLLQGQKVVLQYVDQRLVGVVNRAIDRALAEVN